MRSAHKALLALVAAGALLAGCTSGDSGDSSSTTDAAGGGSTATTAAPTGPAPGVTDDSIKIGVQYVDLSTLVDIIHIDHGDYEAAYGALFDEINANGGINGRTIEPVYAPIDPTTTQAADAACVQLTEDDDVFLVMGFFLNDAVLCPLTTHPTAVVGGSMTPQRLEQAQVPWFTNETGSDADADVVQAMTDAGVFDGHTLGVYSSPGGDEAEMNDVVLPLLDEAGVEVTESATADTPTDDVTASNAATAVIAQRFQSEGIDQVLTVGQSGLGWALGVESTDYRPQVLLTNPNSILAFIGQDAGHDLSVLDDAIAGNLYGGAENQYNLPAMQDCNAIQEAAGVEVPEPDSLGPDDPTHYTAPFTACNNVALVQALLEAAGPDLNYGTFAAGADGLEVQLPAQPDPVTYGPPPAADGDPPMYLFDWDPNAGANGDFVLRED